LSGARAACFAIYRVPPVDFSDEQNDFVDAIRDFCDRDL
jgi:hypothetical protein